MSTSRYLDQDGLDGVLPEPKKTSSKALVWIALLIVVLLGGYFYSSKEVVVDSSSLTPAIEKIQGAVNKKRAIDFKVATVITDELSPSSDLDQDITKDQPEVSIHSDVLTRVADKAKEDIGNTSNGNHVDIVALPENIETELAKNINSSKKTIAEVEKIIDSVEPKVINRSLEYIFNFSSREVESISGDETRRLTHFIEQCDNSVIIVGHTCNLGSIEFNYQLGLDRATSMQQYLIEQGTNPNILTVRSEGMNQPIASNSLKSGRKLNRRVELLCE